VARGCITRTHQTTNNYYSTAADADASADDDDDADGLFRAFFFHAAIMLHSTTERAQSEQKWFSAISKPIIAAG